MARLTIGRVAWRSLVYFARSNAAVAMGVAATTAVITGALLIGDSVRGSLRGLVVQRLSNVHVSLQARTFFDPTLLQTLSLPEGVAAVEPTVIASSAAVEFRGGGDNRTRRAGRVQALAVAPGFWESVQLPPGIASPGAEEVALNATLAAELGVEVGDEVTLRLGKIAGVPGDLSLGRPDDATVNIPRQRVAAVLPDDSIGGFSFHTNQAPPRNVFASLATVTDMLDTGGRVNGALVLAQLAGSFPDEVGQQWASELNLQFRPRLEDYGLQLDRHTRIFPDPNIDDPALGQTPPETVFDYYQLTSKELIIDLPTSAAVYDKVGHSNATRMLAYLANSIARIEAPQRDMRPDRRAAVFEARHPDDVLYNAQRGRPSMQLAIVEPPASIDDAIRASRMGDIGFGAEEEDLPKILSRLVPYSIVVGVDPDEELRLQDYRQIDFSDLYVPYCWINTWLAEQLDAQPGDWVRMTYYQPETADGQQVELATNLMIAGIVPITEPKRRFLRNRPAMFDRRPTVFNDPHMTPSVPGVTDQESISQWDLPFPLTYEIEPVDDEYWNNHRLTPKLFLPYRYAATRSMFASRFGATTSVRVPASKVSDPQVLRDAIDEALLPTRALKGLNFIPIRSQQLEASAGTTPFDALFLSLSFFVIVAALLLVFLLLKLGLQQRATQVGVWLALGFTAARIRSILLREQALVCLLGTAIGIAVGIGYAQLMLAGLETWWVGAITTRFLDFYMTPVSLVLGAVSGGVVSLLTIFLGLRQLSRLEPLVVLRGNASSLNLPDQGRPAIWAGLAAVAGVAGAATVVAGLNQTGMERAGAFFGSGMLLLLAALLALRYRIEVQMSAVQQPTRIGLAGMAFRSAIRNPGRSMLAVSMLAVTSFLISSMSVFQMSPTQRGYGGFDLIAESSIPIFKDPGSGAARQEMLGPKAAALQGVSIVSFRARLGADASCNNLYQVAEPTILGVPPRMAELHDYAPEKVAFDWVAAEDPENPWRGLERQGDGSRSYPVPVILDQNTAAWSLKQGARLGDTIELEIGGKPLYFRTVGLLSNSIFQGKLLIGKENFERLFPHETGFRFFLINSGDQPASQVAELLEEGWSDAGLDVQNSETILQQFLNVQNTYISAFQALGALGLLLGTLGLAAVQLRSVMERRRELALMQAIGFSPRRLNRLITAETFALLGTGVGIGILCAILALGPYVIEMGPQLSLLGPLLLLLVVVAVGFAVVQLTLRSVTRKPLLEALRNE
ncbi:MAG: ABC transporter permease [Planctomycetota bacterium]|nr:MAG: ABC transporter permease [Planctomycetota bacterium]